MMPYAPGAPGARGARLQRALCAGLAALACLTPRALGAPSDYATQAGYTLALPYDPESYFTAVTAFPPATGRVLEGYPLAGRLLAATGRDVLMQRAFGGAEWLTVAYLDPSERPMDPSFVEITPSGATIALGAGFYKPLYVFETALLGIAAPPNLTTAPGVKRYDVVYYDGAWRDERYLFLNAGGAAQDSAILVVDTQLEGEAAVTTLVADIPGASAGIAFDRNGNLITGIGYDYDGGVRTGELRIFTASALAMALESEPLDYQADGLLLADNVLSAASLVVDANDNLFVGGGDLFGTTGALGYAAAIDASVLARVLAGGAPLDRSAPGELTVIAPDPCMNDDSTGVLYIEATNMLLVSANLASVPPDCAAVDYSGTGTPSTQAYFPPGAPDDDGDGIPNGVDPDYRMPDVIDRRDLDRLVRSFGASVGDATYDASADRTGDGLVDWRDYDALLAAWGTLRTP